MYIVDQLRMNVINMDNVSNLSLEGRQIVAYDVNGTRNRIGIYNDDRASEIFSSILESCFLNTVTDYDSLVYLMPEK